jgi:acyl-coenzyme A thioesterase PaaI-like protein
MASENIVPEEDISFIASLPEHFSSTPIPPVFKEMNGRIIDYNLAAGTLTCQFPVEERYQNPYGTMQGGMIAAAIDNTIGPLSALVAPPNVTRQLEIRYKRPITAEHRIITITATLQSRPDPYLIFLAQVRTDTGELAATAKARHFILPQK